MHSPSSFTTAQPSLQGSTVHSSMRILLAKGKGRIAPAPVTAGAAELAGYICNDLALTEDEAVLEAHVIKYHRAAMVDGDAAGSLHVQDRRQGGALPLPFLDQ